MRAAYLTLGCKVNQYDTQAMTELMEADGFETVPFESVADVYIINTCTVTNIADRKSRQMIHRAHKRAPEAAICVCGCLAQRDAATLLGMDGVVAAVGTQDRGNIAAIVRAALANRAGQQCAVGEIRHTRDFERLSISRSGERTRANIKIGEGCENFCSYCIIPYARGPVRSRPIGDIVQEAVRLSRSGVREVVLTGIHIGSYGRDMPGGESLIDVIEAVDAVPGMLRVRLGSIEPSTVTQAFCQRAAAVQSLCPHFHLSLQSGSDGVLQRMNRRYTAAEYLKSAALLREYFQIPAITTDIIAGFPGETQQEHAETLAFLDEAGFAKVHVFPYSERAGTAAACMAGAVPHALRRERAAEISAKADAIAARYRQSFIGRVECVLFEEPYEDGAVGYNTRYIRIAAAGAQPGELADVCITGAKEDGLVGEKLT